MSRLFWLAILAGCAAPGGVKIAPDWASPVGEMVPIGHNTVWSRGGLGLWDDAAHAPNAQNLALVRDLHPPLLRFPGGTRAMRYHFYQAIGSNRIPECDAFTGMTDATGYGIDEFMQVAGDVGAAPVLVAPWVDGSPQEAAALIAYANADAASTVPIGADENGHDFGVAGEWGARRAKPSYEVKYLEMGNEPYLDLQAGPPDSCGRMQPFKQDERWVNGQPIPTTARDHALQIARTAALVHAVDPTVMVGASAFSRYDGTQDDVGPNDTNDPWNRRLVQEGGDFDFFILHPYDLGLSDARLTLADRLQAFSRELKALDPRPQAVTEFGFLFDGGSMMNALVTADVARVAVEEQLLFVLRHILIEDEPGGLFANSAAILDGATTPPYYVMQLLATLKGQGVRAGSADPDVKAFATQDGDRITIVVLDRRAGEIIPSLTIDIALPEGSWRGTRTILSAPHLEDTDAMPEQHSQSGGRFSMPAHSVAFVALERAP